MKSNILVTYFNYPGLLWGTEQHRSSTRYLDRLWKQTCNCIHCFFLWLCLWEKLFFCHSQKTLSVRHIDLCMNTQTSASCEQSGGRNPEREGMSPKKMASYGLHGRQTRLKPEHYTTSQHTNTCSLQALGFWVCVTLHPSFSKVYMQHQSAKSMTCYCVTACTSINTNIGYWLSIGTLLLNYVYTYLHTNIFFRFVHILVKF